MSFNIQDLPVETQLQIFHYIPFVDYFRGLRRVCALWRDLVDDLLTRIHVLNLPNAFNANKTLTLMGPQIKNIQEINLSRCVSLNDKTFVRLLSESCHNLTRIDISKCHLLTDASAIILSAKHAATLSSIKADGCTGFTTEGLTNLLSKTTTLKTLSVRVVIIIFSVLNDGQIRKIKVQPWAASMAPALALLERLTLSACAKLSDADLLSFATASARLVELHLDECRLSAPAVTAAVALLRELRVLTVSYCVAIDDPTLVHIAAHCPKLHTVEVESCTLVTNKGVIALSKLPLLARLNINCCYLVTHQAVEALHLNSPRLVYLDVKGCQSITRDALDKLKETRPHLKIIV